MASNISNVKPKAKIAINNTLAWKNKGNYTIVVAIDFGTDGTAVGWALKNDANKTVNIETNWAAGCINTKAKTNILLNGKMEHIAFGKTATQLYTHQYSNNSDNSMDDGKDDDNKNSINDELLYFSQFKMKLYAKALKKRFKNSTPGVKNKNNTKKVDLNKKIKDANGKYYDTRVVFIEAFKYIKKHVYGFFVKKKVPCKSIKNVDDYMDWKCDDVQWVVTVPAIWTETAKGLMQKWAKEAGLYNESNVNQIVLCYEPDCASISIRNEMRVYNKKQNGGVNNNDGMFLTKGEKYLLLDLGGGTADIACHEVVSDYEVKELYYPTGDAWGSTYIDKRFQELFMSVFPDGWITEFIQLYPTSYLELMKNFQTSKETFFSNEENLLDSNPDKMDAYIKDKYHNIKIPTEFIGFLEDKLDDQNRLNQTNNGEGTNDDSNNNNNDNDNLDDVEEFVNNLEFIGTTGRWQLSEDALRLHYSVWKICFDHIIDSIIDHCKMLLSKDFFNNGKCGYICLAGGFSSSNYLKARIRFELGDKSKYNLRVISSNRPYLAVVDGAVRLGLETGYIKERRSAKTYGIKVNGIAKKINYNNLDDLEKYLFSQNKYYNKLRKQDYVHNVFHVFVRKGDVINIETDKPKTTKFYASQKNTLGVEVFCTDKTHPVFIEGDPIASKDIALPNGWSTSKQFPIQFHFGDTKIRVFMGIDGLNDEDKEIHLEYEL